MNTVIFNGVSLESVAPVKIEDVRISPVEYSPVVRPRAITGGSEFVRMRNGTRTITLSVAVQIKDPIRRRQAFDALSEWARTDAEYAMQFDFAPGRVLYCVCTQKPEPSVRQWWETKLKYTFVCFNNPYWTDVATKTVACGTQFAPRGNAPPLMTIENTFAANAGATAYSDGTNTISFTSIPAGDMVIDLNRQTAGVGGVSIMANITPASVFIPPKTGAQTITGTGNIKYRERWE